MAQTTMFSPCALKLQRRRLLDHFVKVSGCINRTPIALSLDVLGRVLPFYVLLDNDGVVQSVGPSLLKIADPAHLLGRSVFEALRFVKPRRLNPEEALRDGLGVRLTVEIQAVSGKGSLGLFGMAFPIDHAGAPHILIALTPGVNARPFVETHGLKILDFGPADGGADILPLLAMQQDMLEDGKKQAAKLRAARDSAEHLANHDVLTELPNRRALIKELTAALEREAVAVVHVDLDHFKEINDTHGHAAGDAALRHAAASLTHVLGESALCARLGGDEFVGIVNGMCSGSALADLADRVIDRISHPFSFNGEALTVGASVGLAIAGPEDRMSADEILHHADLALYQVKRTGRMKALLCTPELLAAHSEFQLLSADIRRGLAAREFVAHLQPQIDAGSGAVSGFEALARWAHPRRGLLMPGQFLGATDRAGIIQALDAEIRRSALDTLKHWDDAGTKVPTVSLNVTIQDLLDPQFREVLLWDLAARNLDTSRVVLEMVESVLYDDNAAQIAQACQTLVKEGFVLALDDFGTGYASILSLVNLPISIVKIDRAFAAGVARDTRKRALAKSMLGIATTLELEVLAEGVDDDADVAVLREMGCELFQSFHFSRPMAPVDALRWIEGRPLRPSANQPAQHDLKTG